MTLHQAKQGIKQGIEIIESQQRQNQKKKHFKIKETREVLETSRV